MHGYVRMRKERVCSSSLERIGQGVIDLNYMDVDFMSDVRESIFSVPDQFRDETGSWTS